MSETTDKLRSISPSGEPAVSTGRLTMDQAAEILLREQTPARTPAARQPARPPDDDEAPVAAATDTHDEPRSPRTDAEPTEPEAPDAEAAEPTEQTIEEPESTTEDPEYEIKVGDKLERVRLSELQNGYLRQQDYSRKTADHAQNVRAFETDQQEVRKERVAYAELLTALKRQLDEGQQPINWEELRRTNLTAFLEQRELQRERQAKLAAIREEEQRLREVQQKEHNQFVQQAREQARQVLFAKIPAWQQKPEVRQQEVGDLIKTAIDVYGYKVEEVDNVIDPRFVLMARDAMLYHRSRGTTVAAKRVTPMPGRPIPSKRSVPQSDPNVARKQAAQAQFVRKPSINSAIDAILAERGEE